MQILQRSPEPLSYRQGIWQGAKSLLRATAFPKG
jgi:hypothetical protein